MPQLNFNGAVKSITILAFLFTVTSCTEGQSRVVRLGKGSTENGAGYTGVITPLKISQLSILSDLVENAATVVKNFGAKILNNNEALFEGEGFRSYWGGEGYLSVADRPELDLGKEDFSIELSVKFKEVGLYNTILSRWDTPVRNWLIALTEMPEIGTNGELYWQFAWSTDGKNSRVIACAANSPKKDWNELLVSRRLNRISFFVNRALCATATTEDVIAASPYELTLGRDNRYGVPQFIGNIKNVSIIKGFSRELAAVAGASPKGIFCKDGLSKVNCN